MKIGEGGRFAFLTGQIWKKASQMRLSRVVFTNIASTLKWCEWIYRLIKFANANLAFSWIAPKRMNHDIRDEIWVFLFWLDLIRALSLFSIKISFWFRRRLADWDCFASLIIPLFAKNSRLGYFFYANNLTQI